MADGVTQPPEITRATDDHAADSPIPTSLPFGATPPVTARTPPPHADKFRISLAALIGIAIGAIAIAVAVIASGGTKTVTHTAWSSWSPSSSGSSGVTEIADHIAPYYRLSSADQLDVITPLALTNPNPDGTISGHGMTVAVNTGGGGSSSTENLSLLSGKTVAYNICGMGAADCVLAGKPSTARLLLLRREALELALYTFKYIGATENVVVILPPGRTETTSNTLSSKPPASKAKAAPTKRVTIGVLFVREELQPWLDEPLSKTLSPYPPVVSQLPLWSGSTEAGLVDQITARGLFSEQVEAQQTGGSLLILKPLPPQ